MVKVILSVIVVVGIIVAVLVFKNKQAIAPEDDSTPTASAAPKSQTVTVTFANGTAAPNVLNIRVGDTVKFINNDSASRWPASGVHPTHQICPGFDSLRGLNAGETYSFAFREVKTCPWHDHLRPAINGQISVTKEP
jgi:plastocyanin